MAGLRYGMAIFLLLLASVTSASAMPQDKVGAAKSGAPKIYAIVTVTLKSGKDADYLRWLKQDVALQAKAGLRLVASYMVQFGKGNRHIQIWEADSAESIRKAAFETVVYPPEVLDIIDREDIEIAVADPVD